MNNVSFIIHFFIYTYNLRAKNIAHLFCLFSILNEQKCNQLKNMFTIDVFWEFDIQKKKF